MLNMQLIHDKKILQKMDAAIKAAKIRAAAKTATTVRAEWARAMHKELNLSVGEIKKAIYIKQGDAAGMIQIITDSTTHAALGVRSNSKKRSLPLTIFKPRQTSKGVSVKIKRRAGRKIIKHAFIQGMVGGDPESSNTQRRAAGMTETHTGVFIRVSFGDMRVSRLPIKEIRTTALEHVAADTAPEIERLAVKKLQDNYARQFSYEIEKRFKDKSPKI